MHVLKIWKDFEFIKHTVSKYWSVKETGARNEKKMYRQAQTKYLKLNTEHKQSSKRKKNEICICLIFDYYCQIFISGRECDYEEMTPPSNFEVFLTFSFSLRS